MTLKPRDLAQLVTLAALWGASFICMRLGAGEFGALALAGIRVGGSALFLLPLLALRMGPRPGYAALRAHWWPLLVLGLANSALPYLAFAYAALSISSGLSAIFNAATALFAAAIGWFWLHDRLTPPRVAGLVVGFAGVVGLAWEKASFKPGGSGWAVLACLGASACYGYSANYTKRRLTGVPPLAVAAGSQFGGSLLLALPAALWWPRHAVSAPAWAAAALLAFVCTGVALLLYFGLIVRIGPASTSTVTFLIPVFAVLWGGLLLAEPVTLEMAIGGAVILLGTGLTTGLLRLPSRGRVG